MENSAVLKRLGEPIQRLDSDKDILRTVEAIKRVLKYNRANSHTLASSKASQVGIRDYERGFHEGYDLGFRDALDSADDEWLLEWFDMAKSLFEHRDSLARKDREFVEKMYKRRRDLNPTVGQLKYLQGLFKRLNEKSPPKAKPEAGLKGIYHQRKASRNT